MSNPVYTRRLAETLGSDALAELALDLRWSFNHAADAIWQQLDPVLWNLTHNPWFVLQTVSRERLDAVTADREFQQLVAGLVREKRHAEESPAWFQQVHPRAPLSTVAYFSMEFMLSEALPIYSGGLGNVAGDQLKTASNLGGIRAWHVQIGRVRLYLLDTPRIAPDRRSSSSGWRSSAGQTSQGNSHYLPAAVAYRERAANGGRKASDLLKWRNELERCWGGGEIHRPGRPDTGRAARVPRAYRPGRTRP